MLHNKGNATLSIALTIVILYLSGQTYGLWNRQCGNSKIRPKIIGGENALKGQWPWMVHLTIVARWFSWNDSHYCNALLISDQWLLTAAHCFENWSVNRFDIVQINATFGAHNRDDDNDMYKFTVTNLEYFVHGDYNIFNTRNDIALLKLSQPLDLMGYHDYLEPICLPKVNQLVVNTDCVATGWGRNSSYDPHIATILQQVHLPITADKLCQERFPAKFDSNTQLCAGTSQIKQCVYQGDSGGPLNCQQAPGIGPWEAQGIVSYGNDNGCGMVLSPSVFTRVSAYIPWINKITGIY